MLHLFDPFILKGVTLRNRIVVSPMCQYMAREGLVNDWHQTHYASLARGGAGLVIIEATAVSAEGRITWGDVGLWNEEQAEALAKIAAEIKKAGAVPGIQIAHAGRKASSNRPWEGDDLIPADQQNGWPTIAPSAIPFGPKPGRISREMTLDDIARVQAETVAAVVRARDAGFEWLELHMAHGYLAQNFFSPLSNKRTDAYGGSPENRARYLLETFSAVRKVWPEDRPRTVRFGAIDFAGDDERIEGETIALLREMKSGGLDLLDVSGGFNAPEANIPWGVEMMVPLAERLRKETGLPTATGWFISDPEEADRLIREERLDAIMLARPLLVNPHWPYMAAKTVGF
jgi:2,4-dienoyl-CoA reductase-like NADH-dependent reductase (Old Yellow Enzyme family)